MTGGDDGEGNASEGDFSGFEGDEGAAAVDDRDADASERSNREPLGDLRERVVDDEPRAPGASFPEDEDASATGDGGEHDESAWFGSGSDSGTTESDAEPNVPETGRDGPLGDLAAGVDGRRERQAKADDALFDEVEVGEVDADELWSQVESDGPTVEPRGEREVREVAKRKYCSQCPYFSDPPEVACSHEGTDILQQVDMEHFEVADCPVVLEDERLEDVTTE